MTIPIRTPIWFFFSCLLFFSANQIFGQIGKDGVKIINGASTIVNDYTTLLTDVAAGATTIQVTNNNLSSGFTSPLSTGDLVFIIQVQGAAINTADDPSFGTIQSYLNCGNNEFAEVVSIAGTNQISVSCPLTNSYTAAGKVVVVRVPRYSVLTVNGGAGITCPAWNGSTGAIIVIEVSGTTILNSGSTIDASGKGFRGGALQNNNSGYGVLNYKSAIVNYGAEKGEGIAGNVIDYDIMGGRYCKGAPANGGGGGNGHNGGGGGGANAGNISTYTGNGIADISNASWASAWNLEFAGFATAVSSGGGRGGYTFSSSNQNALSVGPGNSAWGGDFRRENGGRGGKPLDYSTGKIFMGGGGGAGEENNSKGGAGGNGGGLIVMQTYAGFSGSGQINANGNNGASTIGINGTDGAGGGGGGGTIVVNTTGFVNGVSLNTNGGNGGNQVVGVLNTETEGPGGGGGGGYIAITGGSASRNSNGGNNGTTNSTSLSEFPPNGATKGAAGVNNGTIYTFNILTQPVNLCGASSTTLTFTIQGTAPPGTTYYWYDQATGGTILGSGTSYTTPVVTSSKTFYIVACPGSVRVPLQVNISTPPTVNFTSTVVCALSSTAFTPGGSASINSWSWDFGDGSPLSTQQNPQHTYSGGGTYSAILTVSDGICSSSITQNVVVTTTPSVGFTSSASVCGSLNVQFTNTTTGTNSFLWNFGDGSAINTNTSPSHLFPSAGTYSVILTAGGSGCSSSDTLSINIGIAPLASFTTANSICQGDTLQFFNQSNTNGQPVVSWNWDFGDGSMASSAFSPSHAYLIPGIYNITLDVNTAACNDDTTITINVTAGPVVNFTANTTAGCGPLPVSFNNTTTGSPTYSWNFGDGSSSANPNPIHTYTASGIYSVTLIATQGTCADTFSVNSMIQVYNSPQSSFSVNNSVCLGDTMYFANSSTGNGSPINSYLWDFGDGSPTSSLTSPSHLYSSPGSYSVVLNANNANCSDDTTIIVNVSNGPIASFSAPLTASCGSFIVNFINTTSGSPTYVWDFGDGSATSSALNPSHNYSLPGTYTVTLVATQGSCADTLSFLNYILVAAPPVSSFSISNTCEGDSVQFVSTSSGGPMSNYSWTFGDGTIGSGNAPSHLYGLHGNYSVQLTVDAATCNDDTTILITVNPNPVVGFSSSQTQSCDSATVTFSNTSTGAATYNWDFGDGNTSNAFIPTHFYSTPGIYTVSLQAITSEGCSSARTRLNLVQIFSTPTATVTASSRSICKNECITFSGQSTPDVTSWQWTISGANPSSATSQNTGIICYPNAGNFDVILNVSNGFCSSTKTETAFIHVADCSVLPVAQFISGDTTLCQGSCIDFVDLSSNATFWNWIFPGAIPGTSAFENPVGVCYNSPGQYSVTLIAGNTLGTDTIVFTNFIQVMSAPSAPAISQNGNMLTSTPGSFYQWIYNGIEISGATGQSYTATLSGEYTVTITDANGCAAMSPPLHVSLVGLEDLENEKFFHVFPNPSNNNLPIFISIKQTQKYLIQLFDETGRSVYSDEFETKQVDEIYKIKNGDLAKGVYFLHILSNEKRRILPLIIQ